MTLSGEAGPPAATSGTFPAGTKLKVTNLDNGQATTVTVNGPSPPRRPEPPVRLLRPPGSGGRARRVGGCR